MRLPNGYGSVFKLSGKRRKPWAVRVLTGYNLNGSGIYKYIGYFKTKSEGLNCLADYHNDIEFYNKTTLEQIYINWSKVRFNKISAKTISMYEYAWTYLGKIKDMDIQDIRKAHLQDILQENETKSRSTHKQIKSLAVQLFKEALENGLVKQNYAEFMEAEGIAPEQKEIFTDAEIYTMLNNLDIPNIDIALILIFTGYRNGELCNLTKFNVDLKSRVLRGGNKTEAGKNKIVAYTIISIP